MTLVNSPATASTRVRSGTPAADGLRDGVGNEDGWNADAGGVQISGRDIEGLSEGGSHAPDTAVAIITANLHCVPFLFDVDRDRRATLRHLREMRQSSLPSAPLYAPTR